MTTLSGLNSFTNGQVIDANQMNANFTTVKNYVEDLSEGSNFDAGAINSEDIAGFAITEAKLATGAVTTLKLGSSLTLTTPNIGAAIGASLYATNAVIDHPLTNERTANYTLVIGDDGIIIEANSTSPITITVPLYATTPFPVGTKITIIRTNTGAVTIAGATVAVTVNATPGLNLRAQWSSATLLKRGTNVSNTWVLMGDLSS